MDRGEGLGHTPTGTHPLPSRDQLLTNSPPVDRPFAHLHCRLNRASARHTQLHTAMASMSMARQGSVAGRASTGAQSQRVTPASRPARRMRAVSVRGAALADAPSDAQEQKYERPDASGRFGRFGGEQRAQGRAGAGPCAVQPAARTCDARCAPRRWRTGTLQQRALLLTRPQAVRAYSARRWCARWALAYASWWRRADPTAQQRAMRSVRARVISVRCAMRSPGCRTCTCAGKYVPETLIPALAELEVAYKEAMADPSFHVRPGRGS